MSFSKISAICIIKLKDGKMKTEEVNRRALNSYSIRPAAVLDFRKNFSIACISTRDFVHELGTKKWLSGSYGWTKDNIDF